MPNMSYCRFYNTYHDLRDCYENLYDDLDEDDEEYKMRQRLVRLCQDIAERADDFLEEKT